VTQLVGFRLSRFFSLSPPFYCLSCTADLSHEGRWDLKIGPRRKGAAPILALGSGAVRYLRVRAPSTRARTKTAGWLVDDDGLSYAEEATLEYFMGRLGLRIAPSIPAPAEQDLRCKNCGVGVLAAPGQPLSAESPTTLPGLLSA